ncbi:L,D-transpeptidase [Myxococcus sp. RHSTA-1-4]|uniref:L,D-transpeptidase n=1 Tax=Myxococcus sp. RHSTA-1-4 TaxID=2874601 RepID=UPI001CBF8AF1|nr:L,D-transpeptidase [Myxococcus sp. RHSTA-1-4]MBZ4420634.1 L,D-transpeptidase [Myxococcus sp. RHSTA-1-4]
MSPSSSRGRATLPGLLGALVLGAAPGPCFAAPDEPAPASPWTLPFDAVLKVDAANVRQRPDARSPINGLLRRGSRFRVTGCAPSCDAPGAWALLGTDGALRLALVEQAPPEARPLEELPEFLYGKVLKPGADVRAEPEERARRVRREGAGEVLAFVRDEALLARGWLARPGGGFVSTQQVRLDNPSAFQGEPNPSAPMAFLVKDAPLTAGGVPAAEPLPRFSRVPLLALEARTVRVPGGTLPRAAVRLAFHRPRPPSIPSGAKWVHVELSEQVLTAYEGDTWVYATLVSTGRADSEDTTTHRGHFRVWSKTLHELMAREGQYFVEEVPYTQYFHGSEALHGAFWHDRFGFPVTHGCVNLSLADARWLFNWAPPALPSGWHSFRVLPGAEPLHVVVERAKPGVIPAVPSEAVGAAP